MKKYSFLTEAFPSDYNKNTFGIFKFIFSNNDISIITKKIETLNFRLKHISKKKGVITSLYYMSPDKTKLIRISDHWSKSNIKGVNQVGYIGNCIWILNSDTVKNNRDKYQVGIIDMIQLRKI
jgi:hypothetical protein